MEAVQGNFEKLPYFETRLGQEDLTNTGAGWLELGHPKRSHALHRTESFIHHWWADGRSIQNGRWMTEFPWEQRVLNYVLKKRKDVRTKTALLEDDVYNSPVSCIQRNRVHERRFSQVMPCL